MSDSMGACGPDLHVRYESLRGHATGQEQSVSPPQGLALLRRFGIPVWMAAWAQVAPATVTHATPPGGNGAPCRLSGCTRELVIVLTEMVLGGRRKE
jgi:hypothetical protein